MFGRNGNLDKVSTAAAAVGAAKPYLDRALHDEDLHDNLRIAMEAAKRLYGELSGDNVASAASKLWNEREVQENLTAIMASLKGAADQMRGAEEKGAAGKIALVLLAGGIAALLLNPKTGPALRGKIAGLIGRGQDEVQSSV